MRILDRYLLKEFVGPVLMFLVSFSLLFVIFDLFGRLGRFLNVNAPLSSIATYYFHYLFAFNGNVSLIVTILPISLLLAALYCASNLVRHNEFVAMMASGVSFTRILAPFAAVGLAASLLAWAAQESQAPRSMRWTRLFEKTVLKAQSELPAIKNFIFFNSAAGRIWEFPEFIPSNTFSIGQVTVTQMRPDGSETSYMTGSAYWADGTWWLRSPLIEHKNPEGARLGRPESYPKRAIEMRNWDESPRDFAVEYEAQQDSQGLSAGELRTFMGNHPDFPKAKRARLETDYYTRFAMPFTCLVVALLGIPAGLKTGRSNVMARMILSLGFFFLFYLSLHVCLYLGKSQWLPPMLAAWLPNLLFAAVGLRMIRSLQ
ncbi:MAG: LptF/LptG family permease [Kiritimatiellia bacterium]